MKQLAFQFMPKSEHGMGTVPMMTVRFDDGRTCTIPEPPDVIVSWTSEPGPAPTLLVRKNSSIDRALGRKTRWPTR